MWKRSFSSFVASINLTVLIKGSCSTCSFSSFVLFLVLTSDFFLVQPGEWIKLHGKTLSKDTVREPVLAKGPAEFGANINNSFLQLKSSYAQVNVIQTQTGVRTPVWIMGSLAPHQAPFTETTLGKQCEKSTCGVGETPWLLENFSSTPKKRNMLVVWIPIWILIPQRQSRVFFHSH